MNGNYKRAKEIFNKANKLTIEACNCQRRFEIKYQVYGRKERYKIITRIWYKLIRRTMRRHKISSKLGKDLQEMKII